MQVSRLLQFARKIWDDDPNGPPLANEVLLPMLSDLLLLQEKALGLLEAEISSVLQLQRPATQLAEELAHVIVDRLRLIIYTRRTQVFRSKHLSSSLRAYEEEHNRSILVFSASIESLDKKPQKTLEEQLAELALDESWVAQSFEQTPKSSSTAPDPELGFPARQREAPARQPTVTRGVNGSKASSGPNNRGREVPPRFKRQKRGFTGKSQETESQDSLTKTGTTLPTQGDPMPEGLYPSYKAKPLQASHAPPHQAPPSTEPPSPPFPELETTVSKLTLGPTGPTPPWSGRSSSGLASISSLTTRSQPTVPAEEETLEAAGLRRQTEMRFGVPEEAPTWPWSSTWSPYSPLLPGPYQAFGRPAYMAGTVEGASSHQAPQNQVGQVWTPISQHTSPSSSFPFTNPQSIAAEAVALLYSSGSQSPPAESHKIAHPQPTSTLAASSGSTLSSLMKGQTDQPMRFPSSSAPSRRPADLHSVEQGVGGNNIYPCCFFWFYFVFANEGADSSADGFSQLLSAIEEARRPPFSGARSGWKQR
ncbi:hypothetical protein, conserved [Eimeria praecox]|uniref:Uncharacterized protein n=1 Tax=Eimeria praecox TaxID=51316 RepID=U6H3W0_9EIME|nr:hypothetical protein, conserved [Eimeria praecox]